MKQIFNKTSKYISDGMSNIKKEQIKNNIKNTTIILLLFIMCAVISSFLFSFSYYNNTRTLQNDLVPGYTSVYSVVEDTKKDTNSFNIIYNKKQISIKNNETSKTNKTGKTGKTGKINNKTNKTDSKIQSGKASHMGHGLQGRIQANGTKHNKNAFICAHRTLPFGTVIKVTNINNGKTVKVTVTDRGPYVKGRIIDLSLAAANKLDFKESGVIDVYIERIN